MPIQIITGLLSYNSYASRTKVNAGMVPITAKALLARVLAGLML